MTQNNLYKYTIDYTLIDDIKKLKEFKILPIFRDELFLIVAVSKDNNLENIRKYFNEPIKFIEVVEKHLEFELEYIDFKLKLFSLAVSALNNTQIKNENSYIINFIDEMLNFCILNKVSDIHCECLEDSVIFRFRIDGELNQFFRFDKSLYYIISSVVKYLGNLDLSQNRIPLNARFSRKIQSDEYDIRVSTMPTIHGESIVLRILDGINIQKDINNIGFENKELKIIKEVLNLNQGLILVTGPTGSGKTTSLYAMLNLLNKKSKKIITIEDPVEYKLDGVMQVNINNDIELDYHTVLKNILRQDPDIIMIGEIRDSESLAIAMQASLTGHLVIATLHTNSAIDTITRLLDLDAQAYLIASTLKMVLSQRLLRILCDECKVYNVLEKVHKSEGCKCCNFTGYKNRRIVSEILKIDRNISNMITNSKNIGEIVKYAKENGFRTIYENGINMVNSGITSLDEFYSKV